MENPNNEIIESEDFLAFVNREFDKTVPFATLEEIAEFAFGSLQDAIEAFKNN